MEGHGWPAPSHGGDAMGLLGATQGEAWEGEGKGWGERVKAGDYRGASGLASRGGKMAALPGAWPLARCAVLLALRLRRGQKWHFPTFFPFGSEKMNKIMRVVSKRKFTHFCNGVRKQILP